MPSIRVDTNRYYGSHMKQPRGRGNWAFEIGGKTVFFRGLYSEVKTRAVKEARKDKRIFSIKVLP